ncbi:MULTISPECIES: AAA family ATPase [unclassified Mycobacterium]|uniref:ATP-binding protein n=1 Tax=unclassified Mycobacterium TaxID=2642494 RepID=UPI0006DBF0FB|nr:MULTISPECIES: adenylate/guanylate cyclase domain-containing protein [unclassified Mycobacterium]
MTGSACRRCGTEPRAGARFCDACGAPIDAVAAQAEHKQVTVLFADVVRSMALAAIVDTERLREVMGDLFNSCGAVIQRYGGTVDKFTGDGIMALFGAPIALEDHAIRACIAALEIQTEVATLARDVQDRDGIALSLRIGLNSGDVVVGQIGASPSSYTAIGAQVGMAQRMEAAAPPGGVMLSEATSRLVEHVAVLGDPQMVSIKGAAEPVPARRLEAMARGKTLTARIESTMVGRDDEIAALRVALNDAVEGRGCVVGVSGPAGIGKSRISRELLKMAQAHGVKVFSTFCESHASAIAFTVVARLARDRFGLNELDPATARAALRTQLTQADPEDLILLDELAGIRDPNVPSPNVSADARRRRLAALLKTAALQRNTPSLYIIEDAHWIDETSEAMLADLMTVIPRTRSMVVVTYRPEYKGALAQTPGFHRFDLKPLDGSAASTMTVELMGRDPSLVELAERIVEQSAGNPFYVQEIVREYAERGVIVGERGAYQRQQDVGDVSVPPTLQATIGARIDRLTAPAKHVLNAATVIGSRFSTELLAVVLNETDGQSQVALAELVHSELIDQVMFTPRAEYAFRHPLVQAVAYQSQLKQPRAELHRRLAAAIEQRNAVALDANAALIAAHLEAAGDLRDAFGWHMRAGTWFTNRDINAARASWQLAQRLADQMPGGEPDRDVMRVAPRALLCGSAWRAGGSVADADLEELRDLCASADTQVPLALGMAGLLMQQATHARNRESLRLIPEYVELLEAIGSPELTVALLYPAIYAKYEACEMSAVVQLAQRVIDLADGDPVKGNLLTGSPLAFATAMRASARCALGQPNWRGDFDQAIAFSRVDPTTFVSIVMFKYMLGISIGAVAADAEALNDTAEALQTAQRCSEDFAVHAAQLARGIALVSEDGADRSAGFELLAEARSAALSERFILGTVPIIDLHIAKEKVRAKEIDGAIELSRRVIAELLATGPPVYLGAATSVLVEALLRRGSDADLMAARDAIRDLAAVRTEPNFVAYELPLRHSQALLARARGDTLEYRTHAGRYEALAQAVEFQGHTSAGLGAR